MNKNERHSGCYYGWNIVALTVLAQLSSYGIAINCMSLYLPHWSRDLHAPVSALAFCYTGASVGLCLLGPVTGQAADKLSIRRMIPLGLAGVAILFAISSQVTHAWQLLVLFATAAPLSMVVAGLIPCQTLVCQWFERRRGLALGLSGLGISLAGAVLPPLLALALPALGWRHLFLLIAGFVGFCAPVTFLLIRNRPSPDEGWGFERGRVAVATNEPDAAVTIKAVVSRPIFWILALTVVIAHFMSAGYLVNLAPMAASRGLGGGQAASLLSAMSIALMASKLLGGYAVDRLGGRAVLGAFMALSTAGALTARFADGFAGLLAGTILMAPSGAMVVLSAAVMAREFGAQIIGRAMGMITFMALLGATAPPAVAFMREVTGDYSLPLLLFGGLGALACVSLVMLRERGVPSGVLGGARASAEAG